MTEAARLKPLCILLAAVLAGCQLGGSTVSEREGYFTWVDEQGRVRYSPIVDGSSVEAEEPAQTANRPDAAEQGSGTNRTPSSALEEETEYTLENYPDAEQLARDGYVRPDERQPYFTWRDAQGNVRVSYYRPDTRPEGEKGRVEPPVQLTEASVYHRPSETTATQSPPAGDPEAFAILGIDSGGPGFLQRFTDTCCDSLDAGYEQWQPDREFGISLDQDSPRHDFLTGNSRYQLIQLPEPGAGGDAFLFRLRSYVRNGVFVPSVVFLDDQRQPLRLVTDLVMAFTPENWHRRGYLEAVIPAFPGRGERWLLVLTRSEDLAGQTVIETGSGPKKIPHVPVGEIGLEELEP